jgi:hypothetical protein
VLYCTQRAVEKVSHIASSVLMSGRSAATIISDVLL